MTRFRVSELTLKRICGRPRLHAEFLTEMQDWLLRAGWALFFADRSFGMIKLEAVESWTWLGSKRIADELDAVAKGGFDFTPLVQLAEPELVGQGRLMLVSDGDRRNAYVPAISRRNE